MPMKNPPHPGLSVRLNCLEPFGLSVTEAARALGKSLSGRAGSHLPRVLNRGCTGRRRTQGGER